jgi:hypothetical protein
MPAVEMTTDEQMNKVRAAAESGALTSATFAELAEYMSWLCRLNAIGHFRQSQYPQICEAVRIQMLRAMMDALRAHISDLDAKNTKTQRWVIALAIAALVGTTIQSLVAIRGEWRAAIEMTAPTTSAVAQPPPSAPAVQTPSQAVSVPLAPKK